VVTGREESAAAAALRLREAADRYQTLGFRAWADHAEGLVRLATGGNDLAAAALARAVEGYRSLRAWYDLAVAEAAMSVVYHRQGAQMTSPACTPMRPPPGSVAFRSHPRPPRRRRRLGSPAGLPRARWRSSSGSRAAPATRTPHWRFRSARPPCGDTLPTSTSSSGSDRGPPRLPGHTSTGWSPGVRA
jgi:hypothetical protein